MVDLKKLREDAGISQNKLAKMCGKVGANFRWRTIAGTRCARNVNC